VVDVSESLSKPPETNERERSNRSAASEALHSLRRSSSVGVRESESVHERVSVSDRGRSFLRASLSAIGEYFLLLLLCLCAEPLCLYFDLS
jgi:hypothetical protein